MRLKTQKNIMDILPLPFLSRTLMELALLRKKLSLIVLLAISKYSILHTAAITAC